MAPPEVIDYIIVHELAHGEAPNHGRRLWRIFRQYCPEYQEGAEWLKEHGVELVFSEEDI
jgi:predicted metal-dependent hydrolase